MTKLFHIKIQVKKIKIDALLDSSSQANLIATNLVSKLGLEVTKQCKIKFVVKVILSMKWNWT
jgi:hypothetical protein